MTSLLRNALVGAALVITTFVGILVYSAKTIPAALTDSTRTLHQFFNSSQRHQYLEARATLTPKLQEQIGGPRLQNLWHEFESKNGRVTKWMPADANVKGGGRVCLWPRYVDYLYRVYGTKGNRVFYARVVPDGPRWRIEQLKIMR